MFLIALISALIALYSSFIAKNAVRSQKLLDLKLSIISTLAELEHIISAESFDENDMNNIIGRTVLWGAEKYDQKYIISFRKRFEKSTNVMRSKISTTKSFFSVLSNKLDIILKNPPTEFFKIIFKTIEIASQIDICYGNASSYLTSLTFKKEQTLENIISVSNNHDKLEDNLKNIKKLELEFFDLKKQAIKKLSTLYTD